MNIINNKNIAKLFSVVVLPATLISCNEGNSVSIEPSNDQVTAKTYDISPSSADINGGSIVIISGSGYQLDKLYTVTFGSIAATDVKVLNTHTLQATVPAGQVSGVVEVRILAGTSVTSVTAADFNYTGLVKLGVSHFKPEVIDANREQTLTVYGQGFDANTTVSILGQTFIPETITPNRIEVLLPVGISSNSTVSVSRGSDTAEASGHLVATNIPLSISSISPSSIYNTGGEPVTILGNGFTSETKVKFGDASADLVQFKSSTELQVVSPIASVGTTNVTVYSAVDSDTNNISSSITFIEPPVGYNEEPRVVGAMALDSQTVVVNFSEPMETNSGNIEFFDITIPDGGNAIITSAELMPGGLQVRLKTLPLAGIDYELHVLGPVDLTGRGLRAPSRENEFDRVIFRGKAEQVVAGSKPLDTDGDGLPDSIEQEGWPVRYTLASGKVVEIHVTSDPQIADSDGDGMSDADELAMAINPRSPDTDGDTLGDEEESNQYGSDPLHQDSDGDGFNDVEELGFGTSISFADTDGDQFSDFDELIEMGRNPRIADLPTPEITLMGTTAAIDVRITQVSSNGTSTSKDITVESTNSNESSATGTYEISLEGGTGTATYFGADGATQAYGAQVSAGYTRENSDTSVQEYNNSLAVNHTTENTVEISREVVDARVTTAVSFSTRSDVAFTLRNLELSLLAPDKDDPTKYIPIASLFPSNEELEINIGPFTGSRGPIIFHATDLIPTQVEQFIKNPSTYIVKVVNYDLIDENDRNFAYTSQEVLEKTAGFSIVYNNGTQKPETYRIATAGKYSPVTGKPLGVSIIDALKSLQLHQVDDAGTSVAQLEITETAHPEAGSTGEGTTVSGEYFVNNSFSVTGGEISRIRETQISLTNLDSNGKNGKPEGYDYWIVLDRFGKKLDATSLATTFLEKKGSYTLIYTRDIDGDGLSDAEEKLLLTSDTTCDSDGDGVSDYREVKGMAIPYLTSAKSHRRAKLGHLCDSTPAVLSDTEEYAWRVGIYERMSDATNNATPEIRSEYYRVYSNPTKADSDNDGISDKVEFNQLMPSTGTIPIWRSDPLSIDTDGDALKDLFELNGYEYNSIDDNSKQVIAADPNSMDTLIPYLNVKDSEGDSLSDGIENIVGTNPAADDKDKAKDDNFDGLPNSLAKLTNGHFQTVCSGVKYPMTYDL